MRSRLSSRMVFGFKGKHTNFYEDTHAILMFRVPGLPVSAPPFPPRASRVESLLKTLLFGRRHDAHAVRERSRGHSQPLILPARACSTHVAAGVTTDEGDAVMSDAMAEMVDILPTLAEAARPSSSNQPTNRWRVTWPRTRVDRSDRGMPERVSVGSAAPTRRRRPTRSWDGHAPPSSESLKRNSF